MTIGAFGKTEPPVCAKHKLFLDEDGRCPRCRQEEWIFDDQAAKRSTVVIDDVPGKGPEH